MALAADTGDVNEPFLQELLELQKQRAIARNNSEWLARIRSGQEPEEAIRLWAHQYFFHTRGFVNALRHLYANCTIDEVREEMAESLFEEDTGQITKTAPHLELYFSYAEAWDLPREKLEREAYILPEMAGIVHWYHYAATSLSLIEALAVLAYAAEGNNATWDGQPGGTRQMSEAFQKHYGKTEKQCEFLDVHAYSDQDHSEVGVRNLARLVKTPEEEERVRAAIAITFDLRAQFSRSLEHRSLDECWKTGVAKFYH